LHDAARLEARRESSPSRALASTHRRDFTVINAPVRPAWAIIGFPLVFDAEFLELCPHGRKPTLEDIDDLVANLGRREGGSVYKPTPTIDFILGADDHLIGIAIHGDVWSSS
jgi:hypothetical protein